MQYLPNDVSKGTTAFLDYQSPTHNKQVTSALGISGIKIVPGGNVSANDSLCKRYFVATKQPFLHLAVMPVYILAELQIAVLIDP